MYHGEERGKGSSHQRERYSTIRFLKSLFNSWKKNVRNIENSCGHFNLPTHSSVTIYSLSLLQGVTERHKAQLLYGKARLLKANSCALIGSFSVGLLQDQLYRLFPWKWSKPFILFWRKANKFQI